MNDYIYWTEDIITNILKKEIMVKMAICLADGLLEIQRDHVKSREIQMLRKYLMNKGAEVDILSKPSLDTSLERTDLQRVPRPLDYYKDIEETDLNDYDAVILYNQLSPTESRENFGLLVEDAAIILYEKLAQFKGLIRFFYCDPVLPPVSEIWRDNPPTKTTWKFNTELVDLLEKKLSKDFAVMIPGIYNPKTEPLWIINEPYKRDFIYMPNFYPIGMKLYVDQLTPKEFVPFEEKKYDIGYWGYPKTEVRRQIMDSLFKGEEDLSKLIIGGFGNTIDWPKTTAVKSANYLTLNDVMSQCLFTIVLGDPAHNDSIDSSRLYEAMLIDSFTFILEDFDTQHLYLSGEFLSREEMYSLRTLMYVKDINQLKMRIKFIKRIPEIYDRLRKMQTKYAQELIRQYDTH